MRLVTQRLPLVSLAVLVANDHVLKGAGLLPRWLTGKASDVAGLFLFPVLVASIAGLASGSPRTMRLVAAGAALAGALVFAALKTSPATCGWLSAHGIGIVADPTDLLAIPALVAAYLYVVHATERGASTAPRRAAPGARRLEIAGAIVAAAASVATSPAPRPFTAWRVEAGEHRAVGCARVDVWTAKSGKEGVGFSIEAHPAADCPIRLEAASITIGEVRIAPLAIPRDPLHEADVVYLPFVFDNEALWNQGARRGRLELVFVVAGERSTFVSEIVHAWDDARPRFPPLPVKPKLPLAVDPVDAGAAPDETDAGTYEGGISL